MTDQPTLLREIQVSNYAVIDRLELEFGAGLTVLTGETGAGKSILVGALGLVLGDRADAGSVRDGADQMEVSAAFEAGAEVTGWLTDQALDADGECLLRRVVSRQGRSRAWINGHAVTLKTMRSLARRLVDIHGQHLHQSLVRRRVQRQIVDDSGVPAALVAQVAAEFGRWQAAADELAALEQAQAERDSRLDLLRFQVQELDALALGDDEPALLRQEQQRLAHAGRLADGAAAALALLSENEQRNAQQLLGEAVRALTPLTGLDAALGEVVSLLNEAEIQVTEAGTRLSDYGAGIDLDPAHRDQVEERLASVQTLSRKHRVEPGDLPARLDSLRAELDRLEDAGTHLAELRERRDAADRCYQAAAAELSAARHKAARRLDRAISAALEELGMPGGQFRTAIDTDPERRSALGCDAIEFEVSANPGQAPRPLAKVASGGELSRISLAIEVMAASSDQTPTMVFDEIDAGIGGGTAEIVGQKLRELGGSAQVLCVTHLPQVASQAHRHVLVSKQTDGKTTRTELVVLDDARRTEELARMLGGVEITATTRRHAREMIDRAAGGDRKPQKISKSKSAEA